MTKKEYIFIDTETTGGRPLVDRIIEIGLYHVIDGEVVQSWQQLINPEAYIPKVITGLTGIDNEMVAAAPVFADVAVELFELLQSQIFVAHNARFDYGFIKNEFKRVGISFNAKTLCTVKLSRLLFPEHKSHALDAIMTRFDLRAKARHRALDDAKVLVDFFQVLTKKISAEVLTAAINKLLKSSSLPPYLPSDLIAQLPDTAGVYMFYGVDDTLLYIGKSICIKERVLSHFAADHASNKEMQLAQQVRRVEWLNTAGELGALLKEAQLIKQRKPIFNRKLRHYKKLFTIRLQATGSDYHQVEIVNLNEVSAAEIKDSYGMFRTKIKAIAALNSLVKDYSLCLKLLNLEKTKHACFNYQVRKCKGACIGEEAPKSYNLRLELALFPLRNRAWPYADRVAIKEVCPASGRQELHIIDNWHYIATVENEAAMYDEIKQSVELNFDMDIYKLLTQFLLTKQDVINVIKLG